MHHLRTLLILLAALLVGALVFGGCAGGEDSDAGSDGGAGGDDAPAADERADQSQVTRADLLVFSPALQFSAREFIGDMQLGYKIALCERDLAIWLAMLLAALGFRRVRGRLRPPPIALYLMLGLAPIALDGLSQLLGYPPFALWETRETLPHFRVLTGALFGAMNIWLIFPHIEAASRRKSGAALRLPKPNPL